MRKPAWLIVLLIGSTTFVTSCKKKDKGDECTLNEANFSGSYQIESVKYKASPASPETDGTSLFFDPCELDDVTTFNNTSHTYTYSDAGIVCTPNGDDNGTWSLSGNSITVDGTAEVIENFSCSNFSLSQTSINTAGDKITITFKKQ
jgi:hypothetical protein